MVYSCQWRRQSCSYFSQLHRLCATCCLEVILVARKVKIAIVNRSFWPIYPVVGEGLLKLAEELSTDYIVAVIVQDHANIKTHLKRTGRGFGVRFFPIKAWSNSASGILIRVLDSFYFMVSVFFTLLWVRPKKIYVSTDPPVLVPFIVMIYCKIVNSRYVYHLQDIHPEATNIVFSLNKWSYKLLFWMDNTVVRNADKVITITDQMAKEIKRRANLSHSTCVHVIANPAVSFEKIKIDRQKIRVFSFCGNAGRLQRIPLLVEAIDLYFLQGGQLQFAFAGSGVFQNEISTLAKKYKNVKSLGFIDPSDAAQLSADYEWALLPIEDEVTRYAFPSKSSSYAVAGALILAICGESTSVGEWVKYHNLGVVVKPDVINLVNVFHDIERGNINILQFNHDREQISQALRFDVFVDLLKIHMIIKDA